MKFATIKIRVKNEKLNLSVKHSYILPEDAQYGHVWNKSLKLANLK